MATHHTPLAFPNGPFPKEFVWAVATSAFQIEGASQADGKGPSIWDTFCKKPGAILDHSNGDHACEHLQHLDDDLDLIRDLGVNAYRFSIAWPRVRPTGAGAWNAKGLDIYERLVDGLLARGLAPYATLNHWDLPQALQDVGGWNNRDTVHRFVEYACGIHARLGDRLHAITTHNEPWVVAVLGHESGIFAPGIQDRRIAAQVSHHLLLSHGMAVTALREHGYKGELGIVLNLSPVYPATSEPNDVARAKLEDGRLLRWYMDPLFKGEYPEDVLADLGADAPQVQANDMAMIRAANDYLGINYYTRSVVNADNNWRAEHSGLDRTDMGWEIYPEGLTDLLLRLKRDYANLPPIYITENGGAFKDELRQGQVADLDRIHYLSQHISAVQTAMHQGVAVKGYMVWSLMDNFEWASGYAKRFGIVHVDYATQQRTLKQSAHWYRDFLSQQNVASLVATANALGA